MGDLQRDDHVCDHDEGTLRREVRPPETRRGQPGATLGLLAAAMLMAASIDAALWQQDLARRQVERRAIAAEARAASLLQQTEALRDRLEAAQRHASALHDELLRRGADEPRPSMSTTMSITRAAFVEEVSR